MKVDHSILVIAVLTPTDTIDNDRLNTYFNLANRQPNLAFQSATADLTTAEAL